MVKKVKETDPEQSARFREAVTDLDAAGELSPTGEATFDALMDVMRQQVAQRVEGQGNFPSERNPLKTRQK